METPKRKFDLEDRLIDFAVVTTEIVELLPNNRTANHIAGQLARSSTSPMLNYGEARGRPVRRQNLVMILYTK
jgi:four helix bundle protein